MKQQAVIDAVNQLFIQTDAKAWDKVEGLFTDKVAFDVTSLVGGKPQILTGKEIVAGWKSGLEPVKSVHHQVGNFVVTFDAKGASVFANGLATHFRAGEAKKVTWFVGTYNLHLVQSKAGWKLDAFKLNLKYMD